MDVEDLVQFGALSVKRYEGSYNAKRGAYTTFVQTVVSTELENYLASFNTGKRWVESTPLEAPAKGGDRTGTVMLEFGTTELGFEDISLYDTYCQLYRDASPKARMLLGSLIGYPIGEEVPKKRLKGFRPSIHREAVEEISGLCQKYNFSYHNAYRLGMGRVSQGSECSCKACRGLLPAGSYAQEHLPLLTPTAEVLHA